MINAYITGQAGVFTATDGLQVAYLSGRYSEQDYTASTDNKSLVGFDIMLYSIRCIICIKYTYSELSLHV